ncbi:type ISP restriction/modification enzyme [Arthrobacter sp. MP_2.3]|uniref:type ISP restriction/modification enzyme n=1 Tax=Arthrobacter sp. MP_2.3 TaxID=3349633 RepID=UPI0038D3E023
MGAAANSSKFSELIEEFGVQCKAKLAGPGEREALISGPVSNLMTAVGSAAGLPVVTHDEVREMDGALRADFAISVKGALSGHIELKAPGVSLDPETYGKTTHNHLQWQRLKELPNLLHTNGLQWRLWRRGELKHDVYLGGASIATAGKGLTAGSSFDAMIRDFLSWEPSPITSVKKLVDQVAPLARVLREEVLEALRAERRAIKGGADKNLQPFLGAAQSWRRLLMPAAKDEEFADGYAQTVTFALLLARAEGLDLKNAKLHDVSELLDSTHSLMGKALDLLTKYSKGPVHTAVELLTRVISAVEWLQLSNGSKDVYLHLYEDFLENYDPELREKTGSYYTPPEVVEQMVRITEEALKSFFAKPRAFRDPSVAVVDGSMGTGTYPLEILNRAADQAEAEYGKGAIPEALTSLAPRLFGLELQSGPFSVAELRITGRLKKAKADLPPNGLNLFVADTLESPWSASSDQLSYTEQLIAAQRQRANAMKRERNVQVVISNPPYEERATGLGGWIESGDQGHSADVVPLNDFKYPGNGKHEGMALKNLYIYFWRWAMWKVFESTPTTAEVPDGGDGIVCYISANGYLTGRGFKGMRKYLRETCSHGWIIDLTPEGKRPPKANAIFNIETPVAIAMFIRTNGTEKTTPAVIKHVTLTGDYAAKMAALSTLTLDDGRWQPVRGGWTAPFTPASSGGWDSYPALDDIMPWGTTGVTSNRGWVYSPCQDTLESRFRTLVLESDRKVKAELLKTTRDSTIDKKKKPLPAVVTGDNGELKDTEQDTHIPLGGIQFVDEVKTVPVMYRSFDRQYVIADYRVLDMPRPPLWSARKVPGQMFVVEQHSIHPRRGPGLVFSADMPDQNAFNNRGGRTSPLYHPEGSQNLTPGLLAALSTYLGREISGPDLLAYMAGVTGHPQYVEHFTEDLSTPGIRVPFTADPGHWDEAVRLGREVLWLESYGRVYVDEEEGRGRNVREKSGFQHASYLVPVKDIPDRLEYEESTGTLKVGQGRFGPVAREVVDYEIGGVNVLRQWFGYRKKNPNGKVSSELDRINPTKWVPEWSTQLLEILSVLTQLNALHKMQSKLLEQLVAAQTIGMEELEAAGVKWPSDAVGSKDRAVKESAVGTLFE